MKMNKRVKGNKKKPNIEGDIDIGVAITTLSVGIHPGLTWSGKKFAPQWGG